MKKLKISILFFLSLAMVTSCDKDFEETNTNPDRSTELPPDLLLGYSQRFYANTVHGVLGGAGGDMGAIWAQQWTKVQYNEEEQFIPRRGVIDNIYSNLYSTVCAEANFMAQFAEAEGNSVLQGVGLVMQGLGFQTLTELYGPIPFTEALDGSNLRPAFDDEATVWAGVLDLYTRGAALIASGDGQIVASSDLFYGGDASKWLKFANSLKFRALMRASSVIDVSGDLQALVNGGQLMSSNSDSAELVYQEVAPDANPIWELIEDGNRPEYKINSLMVETLETLNDPRLAVYAAPAETDGAFRGKPAGFGNQTPLPNDALGYTYANISGLGSFYLNPTLPGVILSYSELSFLMAEAANEGLISGGLVAANNYYNNGIAANFSWNGLDASGYLSQESIPLTSQEDARNKIANQKWISLFSQGFEAWTEWRRTKLPVLNTVAEADINEIASRYFYPTTSVSLNKENYEEASASIGGDELTSKLIWQQ